MKSFKYLVLPALASLALSHSATAQPVYRCGNSYSQTPCTDAVTVQADDPRTDAQRAAAKEGLARDKLLAREMEAARHKDEAQALARDKMAMAERAKAAARLKAESKKSEEKKVPTKQPGASKKQRAQDKAEAPFTVTVDSPGGKKSK